MEVLQRTANRGSISTGYDIDNSCKFEADNVEVMTHTYDSAPTSQKKMTISMWYKRTEVGSNIGLIEFGNDASGDYFQIRWGRDVYGSLETYGMRFGSTNFSVGNTYGAVRDTSAWYHIVVAIDTTQGTAANRFKVYRNGAELGWSTDNRATITQNQDLALGENGKRVVVGEGAYRYNGYIAEVNYVDGQQLSSTDFGEYDEDSGIWKPKAYTGTYGNNGFYLDFKNASNLGEDQSGNNHDFTLSNITAADQATDTPTNNFATFNVLQNQEGSFVFTEGATTFNTATPNQFRTNLASIAVTNGKWYAEFSGAFSNNSFCGVGVMDQVNALETSYLGAQSNATAQGMGYYSSNGYFYRNAGSGAWGDSYTTNDIIGVALDYRSDGTAHMYVAKNGTWQNSSDPATDTSPLSLNYGSPFAANTFLAIGASIYDNDGAVTCNFGGYTTDTISSPASDENGYGTFEYAPPSGYYALCTKNLAEFG